MISLQKLCYHKRANSSRFSAGNCAVDGKQFKEKKNQRPFLGAIRMGNGATGLVKGVTSWVEVPPV
jgi:hypothetical protein